MTPVPSPSCTEPARIGPNAVIQLAETLRGRGAHRLAREVFHAGGCPGWLADPPDAMVDEAAVARLHAALHRLAPPEVAGALAAEAGARTGDYILAHRIPRPARLLLRLMPPGLAAHLLLKAISRHAWTFAGSGRFSFAPGRPAVMEIGANPLAVADACVWHEAVFTRLFRSLVHADTEVRETACCGRGDDACRFEVRWPKPLAPRPRRLATAA